MTNKKGFVLLETIVVTTVLGIVLLSAYPSFASLLSSMESTNAFDNVDYLYRTKSYNNTVNEQLPASSNIKVICEGTCTNTLYDVKAAYLVNQTKINDIIKNENIYVSTKRYLKYLSKNTKKRSDTTSTLLVVAYKNENEPDSDNYEYASVKYSTEEERAFAIEEKSEPHFSDIPDSAGKQTLVKKLYSLAKGLNQQKPFSSKCLLCKYANCNYGCDGEVYYDPTNDHNLRMSGEINYITFNDEMWRIIGLMTSVDDGTGKKEERVKIVRDDYLPNPYSWDSSAQSRKWGEIVPGYGKNKWAEADLMQELNDESKGYLINKIGKDSWYDGESNHKTDNNYDQSWGLKTSAKNLIDNAVWYLGNVYLERFEYNFYDPITYRSKDTPLGAYTRERNESSITKKVGLIYASDYGFSLFYSNGWKNEMYNNYKSSFLNKGLVSTTVSHKNEYNHYYDYNQNKQSDYDIVENYAWTISTDWNNNVVAIRSEDGATGITPAYGKYSFETTKYDETYNYTINMYVKPVVYLKASVLYKSGDGTKDNPYKIGLT